MRPLKNESLLKTEAPGRPKIYKALVANSSSPLLIEINDDRRVYFLIEFPIHPEIRISETMEGQVTGQVGGQVKLSELEFKNLIHLQN